jgi:hypothetical protein
MINRERRAARANWQAEEIAEKKFAGRLIVPAPR